MKKNENKRFVASNLKFLAKSYMCETAGELTVFANRPACVEIRNSLESIATDLPVLEDVTIPITDENPHCQGTAIHYCEITLIPDEDVAKRETAYHNNHLLTEYSMGLFRVDFFITRHEAENAYDVIDEALKQKNFRDTELLLLLHLHIKSIT